MANYTNLLSEYTGAGPSPSQIKEVTLTPSQVTALMSGTTGYDLLPSPGVNNTYLIEAFHVYPDANIEIVDIDFGSLTGSSLIGTAGTACYVSIYDTASSPIETERKYYFNGGSVIPPGGTTVAVNILGTDTAADICTKFKTALNGFTTFTSSKITPTYLRVISSPSRAVQQGLLPDISSTQSAQAAKPTVSVKRKGSVVATPYITCNLSLNLSGFTAISLPTVRQTPVTRLFTYTYTNPSDPLILTLSGIGGPEGNLHVKVQYKTYAL
jgi:hypothetical protein